MTALGLDAGTDMPGAAAIDRESRRALIRGIDLSDPAGPGPIDGVDRVEVLSNYSGTPGHVHGAPQQRTLLVHLLRGPVPADLRADRVCVLGGMRADPRVNPVRVLWAYPATELVGASGVSNQDRTLVSNALSGSAASAVLVVRTSTSGDWSTYVLALLGPGGTGYPTGFDEALTREPFTFTIDCPNPLDCADSARCPPVPAVSPLLDYLARDYPALRRRLLDRFAELVPGWQDSNPADPAVTLLELMAHVGDRLTLWQDSIAAESSLPTARQRPSVRRHARLLDYRVHEGVASRVWLTFTVSPLAGGGGAPHAEADWSIAALSPGTNPPDVSQALAQGAVIFEIVPQSRLSLPRSALTAARNDLALHAWGDVDACLPVGATSAYVAHPSSADPGLAVGDVLVLVPVDEDEKTPSGDMARRRVVRLIRDPVVRHDPLVPDQRVLQIEWGSTDALDAPLPVSFRRSDGTAGVAALALANVRLAEHAATLSGQPLDPPQVSGEGRYRPRLAVSGTAWVDETIDESSATTSVRVDPRGARAQVRLNDGARIWDSMSDLLGSGPGDAHFVAEPEESRNVRLRYGDGTMGRRPAVGDAPVAHIRLGGGTEGNVGAEVLTTVMSRSASATPAGVSVTNPLPATGGMDPELIDAVRALAPHAFRTQLRAVTSADYAAAAGQVAGVQRAVARRRWTGSWYAQEVTLDIVADRLGDVSVEREVTGLLAGRRMAGLDVQVAPPVLVPLEIVVGVCVADGYLRADVRGALLRAMSADIRGDGRRGFFHPDNFSFGQPLYLSDLVAAVMEVAGVSWVDVEDSERSGLRFRRLGLPAAGEVSVGRIDAQAREVLRADSDPSTPENGRFDMVLRGGS